MRYPESAMPRINRHQPGKTLPAPLVSSSSRDVSERQVMKIEYEERRLLKSVDQGEWTRVAAFAAVRARYARFAKATLNGLRRA
jgi:hypothetical protein